MRRIVTTRTFGALLVWAGPALAAEEPPPLSPPALTPPPAATAPAETRPVLVVPGVTAPRSRPRPPSAPPATPRVADGLPALDGPNDLFAPTHPPSASPRLIPQPSSPPERVNLPLSLEAIPGAGATPAGPRPGPAPAPERTPAPRPPDPNPDPAPAPRRRPPGVFGRLLPSPSFLNGRGPADPRRPVTVEPRSDPAADAALKRRIERQIHEALGDRVRAVDVRVVDREVTIRAKAVRFWQRRGVRHTLESLPALSGYRAKVELGD